MDYANHQGARIISCVDNDDAGRRFESENHFTRSQDVRRHLDDLGFKDWNELLVFKSSNPDANLNADKPEQKQQTSAKPFFKGRK